MEIQQVVFGESIMILFLMIVIILINKLLTLSVSRVWKIYICAEHQIVGIFSGAFTR